MNNIHYNDQNSQRRPPPQQPQQNRPQYIMQPGMRMPHGMPTNQYVQQVHPGMSQHSNMNIAQMTRAVGQPGSIRVTPENFQQIYMTLMPIHKDVIDKHETEIEKMNALQRVVDMKQKNSLQRSMNASPTMNQANPQQRLLTPQQQRMLNAQQQQALMNQAAQQGGISMQRHPSQGNLRADGMQSMMPTSMSQPYIRQQHIQPTQSQPQNIPFPGPGPSMTQPSTITRSPQQPAARGPGPQQQIPHHQQPPQQSQFQNLMQYPQGQGPPSNQGPAIPTPNSNQVRGPSPQQLHMQGQMPQGQGQPPPQQLQQPHSQHMLQPGSQQSQGPPSQQPLSQQSVFPPGQSPMVVSGAANAIGRAPTPSAKSNQSRNEVSADVMNTPEYQETLNQLIKMKPEVYRLMNRGRIDGDRHTTNLTKILEIIDGTRKVKQDLIEKLIKNINQMKQRLCIAQGLKYTADALRKDPLVDMTELIPDPYAKWRSLTIRAPKEYYQEAEEAKNDEKGRQYMVKQAKWFVENNYWNGREPIPYPFPRTFKSQATIEEINDEYNCEMRDEDKDDATSVDKERSANRPALKKKVGFDLDFKKNVEYLLKVPKPPLSKEVPNPTFGTESSDSEEEEGDGDAGQCIDAVDEPEVGDGEIIPLAPEKEFFYDADGVLHSQPYGASESIPVTDQSNYGGMEVEPVDEGIDEPQAKRIKMEAISDPAEEMAAAPMLDINERLQFEYQQFLERQKMEYKYGPVSFNSQQVQSEQQQLLEEQPPEPAYQNPILDPPSPHQSDEPKPDCIYNCCAPYHVPVMIDQPFQLPQAAATELRQYRHRIDYECPAVSNYAPYVPMIITPRKANAKYNYPEVRILIPKNYPQKPAEFEIVKPSTLLSVAAQSYYRALEKKIMERRLCDVNLCTIPEIVSALRFCVESLHENRDQLDLSYLNLKV